MKIKEQHHSQTADEISPSQPEKGQAPCPDNQGKTADSSMYFAIGVSEDRAFIPSAEPAAETGDGFLLNRLCEQAEQNRQANVKFGAGIDTAEKQTVPGLRRRTGYRTAGRSIFGGSHTHLSTFHLQRNS